MPTYNPSTLSQCEVTLWNPSMHQIVEAANGAWYAVGVDQVEATFVCYLYKSTDKGRTWVTLHTIDTLRCDCVALWYDRWTDGNSGTLIHIVWFEATQDDVNYKALETADDTISAEVQVFAGASTAAAAGWLDITRTIGGNLYVAFDIDGGTETGFYRSTTVGALASFAARTNAWEATRDMLWLCPNPDSADTNDLIAIYWDQSADEISRKNYDDSANSWAETSISTGMVEGAIVSSSPQFAVTFDHANNKIILAAWNAQDAATADLMAWSISDAAITALTNINTDADNCTYVALALIGTTIYAVYAGKSDGSQVFDRGLGTGTQGLYYKTSTDGGTTWSAEQTLLTPAQSSGAIAGLGCDPRPSGGVDQVVTWRRGTAASGSTSGYQQVAAVVASSGFIGSGLLHGPIG